MLWSINHICFSNKQPSNFSGLQQGTFIFGSQVCHLAVTLLDPSQACSGLLCTSSHPRLKDQGFQYCLCLEVSYIRPIHIPLAKAKHLADPTV